jgi:hypothetical protein
MSKGLAKTCVNQPSVCETLGSDFSGHGPRFVGALL